MSAYTTSGFQWSIPDQKDLSKKPSPSTTKLANPLIKQTFSPQTSTLNARIPFSPVDNHGLRQRRQQEKPLPNNTATTNGKRPVRPPTESFLLNGDVGFSSEATFETSAQSVPQLVNDSLERWVVVYGYASEVQYNSILRRFQSFGKIVSHRGSCRPGKSNWIALQYETSLQAQKALSQQNCLLMDGVLVGVTGLTPSLKQSLEWNPTASLSSLPQVASNLNNDKFQTGDVIINEEDILVLSPPNKKQSSITGGKGTVCDRFMSWWFGWA